MLLRNPKANKLSPNYNPSPCEVINRKGGEVTVRSRAGVDVKRNVSFVKRFQERPSVVEKVDVESAHEEHKRMNQTKEGKEETGQARPTSLPTPIQQTDSPSPRQQMRSPRPTRILDYLDDLMTMNFLEDSWTLLLVGPLTLC